MKKILLVVLALAVLCTLPLAAQAQSKTEFELGGYIRMDAIWNSQQGMGHTLANYSVRDNVANATHGRFQMNANATRFNFTIKGPELWGGKVTGFIEVDFDGGDTTNIGRAATGVQNSWVAVNDSSFGQAKLRLRHAMFKINWTDRELLFGQFWSINSEMIPEVADSGAYCLYGATQLRVPQVRFTYKFNDQFNASIALASGQNGRWGLNVDSTNPAEGETSETPMVELKGRYEADLYGKAGWYGKPRAFYVGVGAAYFRSRNAPALFTNTTNAAANGLAAQQWNTFGFDNFSNIGWNVAGNSLRLNVAEQRYHDHWLFLIENFTPIIPTTSKNLAGTLSLAHQWWVGQGVSAWRLDLPGTDRYYRWNGDVNVVGTNADLGYDMSFIKRFGGWAQLQYYWTEQIYSNLNGGFMQAFDFGNRTDATFQTFPLINNPGNIYANPLGFDPIRSAWRVSFTQWYRPIPAVKFALQYAYLQTNYFQTTTVGTQLNNKGGNHSMMANAWYMF